MKKILMVCALVSLSACSSIGAATGTVGGAAQAAVQSIGNLFSGDN